MEDDTKDISLQLETLERMLTQLYEVGDPSDEQIIHGIEELAAAIRADLDRRGAFAGKATRA